MNGTVMLNEENISMYFPRESQQALDPRFFAALRMTLVGGFMAD